MPNHSLFIMQTGSPEWFSQQPDILETRTNEDGSKYIPIEFIKPKLDELCRNWSTKNFTHQFIELPVFDKAGNNIGKTLWVSGSIELILSYQFDIRTEEGKKHIEPVMQKISRNICGSATFDVQKYFPNTNWGQTCLSLCIVAAAKELGTFFGKELNKEVLTVPTDNKKKSIGSSKIKSAMDEITKTIAK